MTDQELVRAAIAKSGLSHTQFAKQLLARDGRQIRRWLAGHPIPQAPRAWLFAYLGTPDADSGLTDQRTE